MIRTGTGRFWLALSTGSHDVSLLSTIGGSASDSGVDGLENVALVPACNYMVWWYTTENDMVGSMIYYWEWYGRTRKYDMLLRMIWWFVNMQEDILNHLKNHFGLFRRPTICLASSSWYYKLWKLIVKNWVSLDFGWYWTRVPLIDTKGIVILWSVKLYGLVTAVYKCHQVSPECVFVKCAIRWILRFCRQSTCFEFHLAKRVYVIF